MVILNDKRHDLLVCIAYHRLAGFWRVCGRGARIQQTQKIIDFGYRAYGRARIVACGLLLDGYYRAKACDGFNFRLFQNAHEMLRICGKRIHVSALAFCIYGVKGKRRLSASAESGHYYKAVSGNRQVDPFQIMGFGPFDFYIVLLFVHR